MLRDIYNQVDRRILGRRLAALRKDTNFTQEQVAKTIGITRQTFGQIEKGESLPNEDQLVALARLYNLTLHELLKPNESTASLEVQFRKTPKVDELLDKELAKVIKEVEGRLADYRALEVRLGASMPNIQTPTYQISLTESPVRLGEDVAIAERNRLGRGDAPIRDFIEVLQEEEEALAIFQVPMPGPVAGFFGYDPGLGPCIVLNLLHPAERRNWTLAHEYAHFLTRRHEAQILVTYTYAHIPEPERFANAFAKAFLMPSSSVSRRFHRIKQTQGKFQPADISRLAHTFCVSFEAMCRRMEELRLVLPNTFEDLRDRGYQHREALEHLRLDPYEMSARSIPHRFEYLIGMAREQALISEEQAMEFMSVTRAQLRKRLKLMRTQTLVTESGKVNTVEIPLTNTEGA